MVDHQYFAHEGRNGSEPAERIRAAGYLSSGGAWRIGENLAWGTGDLATPRSIMAAWMHSAGHRANILMPQYRQIGFGVIAGNPNAPRRLRRHLRHRVRRRRALRAARLARQRRTAASPPQGREDAAPPPAATRPACAPAAPVSRSSRAPTGGRVVGRVASVHAGLN